MLPKEIFISHSDRDRPFVAELVSMVRRHGLSVWYSNTDIVGARQWHDEIGAALRRCDWFVLVLSPRSVESIWVKRELLFALQQERFDNRIVPLLYQSCSYEELSWTLSAFQMIDFTQTFEAGCQALLRLWGLGFQR